MLSELAASGQLTREELLAAQSELTRVERELFGPKPRARRGEGARALILSYMKERVGQPVSGEVLHELTGIQEWARRVRELRVEQGYEILEQDGMYTLVSPEPDDGAAARWALANRIRRTPGDGRSRVLEYFKANVGSVVTLAELHYVGGIKEVPRRVRELRDEMGFRISSQHDRPELQPDQYVLETLAPVSPNERRIKLSTRAEVLKRDGYRCVRCGATPGAGVWLEVDHIAERLVGGSDIDLANLQTLCNSCHAAKTATFQRERRDNR